MRWWVELICQVGAMHVLTGALRNSDREGRDESWFPRGLQRQH